MAQPAWKTRTESDQPAVTLQPRQPVSTLPGSSIFFDTVVEEDGDATSAAAASTWSPPDGYQSSTSTQRNADAARDAQDDASLESADWDEFWKFQTDNIS